jgi:hypothetical protein
VKGQVSAFWLNALIITTTLLLWLSVAVTAVGAGLAIYAVSAGSWSSSDASAQLMPKAEAEAEALARTVEPGDVWLPAQTDERLCRSMGGVWVDTTADGRTAREHDIGP